MCPVAVFAIGYGSLFSFAPGLLPSCRVDAFLVLARIMTGLALNLLDHFGVRNLIRIEALMTLYATQRLVSRLLQLRAIDKERD